MTTRLLHLVDSVFSGAPASVLADYLDEQEHTEAPVIRHMTNPADIVRLLLGNGLTVVDTLTLPLTSRAKLEIVLHPALYSDAIYSQLACDFAEHVLPAFEAWNPHDQRPRFAIELSRKWQIGAVSDDALFEASHATKSAARDAKRAGNSAAGFAANAAGAASDEGGDALDASHYARLSGGDVEFDWQVARIQTVLQEHAS